MVNLFISHIHEEAKLAEQLKDIFVLLFADKVKIFISSDKDCINLGDKWFSQVDRSLQESNFIILLCSPFSISRPWINFEAGAGWIKAVPLIPVCHSGQLKSQLPVPLNLLQAMNLQSEADFKQLVGLIAKSLAVNSPSINWDPILQCFKHFEDEYLRLGKIRYCVTTLASLDPKFRQIFDPKSGVNRVKDWAGEANILQISPLLDALRDFGMITYTIGTSTMITALPAGQSVGKELEVIIQAAFVELYPKLQLQV